MGRILSSRPYLGSDAENKVQPIARRTVSHVDTTLTERRDPWEVDQCRVVRGSERPSRISPADGRSSVHPCNIAGDERSARRAVGLCYGERKEFMTSVIGDDQIGIRTSFGRQHTVCGSLDDVFEIHPVFTLIVCVRGVDSLLRSLLL